MTPLMQQLMRDEGKRLDMYRCPAGYLTIGYGHNLETTPISARAAAVILEDDVNAIITELAYRLPWVFLGEARNEARNGVLVNMAYNMGVNGLLTFKKFLTAVQLGDWATAKAELLDSKYATQVGDRAKRLAKQIETGEWQ